MSTKTMRPPPRRVVWASTTSTGNSSGSKRKQRDDGFKRPTTTITTGPTPPIAKLFKPDKPRAEPESEPELEPSHKGSKPMTCSNNNGSNPGLNNNQLLAGYMAHEFLTKGTLLGRRWGPAPSPGVEPQQHKYERYVEVAHLLKTNGAHLLGVVNPTQLAHVLRLS